MMMRAQTISNPFARPRTGAALSAPTTAPSLDASHGVDGHVGYEAEVLVTFAGDDEAMVFSARRIGPRGMFVESTVLFDSGDRLEVTFPAPDGSPIRAVGRVTELDFGEVVPTTAGMEVVFVEIDADDHARLARLTRSH